MQHAIFFVYYLFLCFCVYFLSAFDISDVSIIKELVKPQSQALIEALFRRLRHKDAQHNQNRDTL